MTLKRTQNGISYRITGPQGAPFLLLVQGLAKSSQYWLGFPHSLSTDFQVITFDARGFGASTRDLPWGYDVGSMAEDVKQIMVEERIEKAHLFGVSLGGMIVLSFTSKYPQFVASAIVVNASTSGSWRPRISARALWALAMGAIAKDQREEKLSEVILSPRISKKKRREIVASWRDIEASDPIPVLNTMKQLMAAARFKATAQVTQQLPPVLILAGAEDQFVPQYNSHALAEVFSQAKIRTLPKAGHEPYLDQEKKLILLIKQWVSGANGET